MKREGFPIISHMIQDERLFLIAPRKKLTQEILDKLRRYEESRCENDGLHDERVWTLLFTYGFVAGLDFEHGLANLARILTEGECEWAPNRKVWLETLPFPPRKGLQGCSEGNTNVDLVVGDITIRGKTEAGIEFSPNGYPSWICMVEVKWLSDIACQTTHDLHRNQLIRVIENALTFQTTNGGNQFPDQVHVTLLTPRMFRHDGEATGSRFYYYKYNEYKQYPYLILTDLARSVIGLRKDSAAWVYPAKLASHLERLRLHWVTFEELFETMPDSEFKGELKRFIARRAKGVVSV